ncbi:hypothetical protein [Campylobacter sp. 19-13652]|uniref:hypothetical protein n=1 Tax=Campylobacter sp. 19-13652 TaxID=2840180 RepID=UPI001C785821|nr:hypothetical protein [Campylobacter sp. 19-13652]BCX80257.1 hypothetical protein LBC_17190 [Campylobacter sp. 19-13652]
MKKILAASLVFALLTPTVTLADNYVNKQERALPAVLWGLGATFTGIANAPDIGGSTFSSKFDYYSQWFFRDLIGSWWDRNF